MALPGELTTPDKCEDCDQPLPLEVLSSAAGFYIGTSCHCGPYSRVSGYYTSRDAAQAALDGGEFGR